MSARTTRKRARTESDEALKQEPDVEARIGTRHGGASDPQPVNPGGERELNDIPALKRNPEFWFSDGTVTLLAKNVEFRFYKALLADRSPVFKAMFAEQHPFRMVPIDEHHSIPCPVVRLTDSPEDLRHILRAYVPGKQSSLLAPTAPSFHLISAYARLGRKYELEELREQSHQFLKSHYTDDLGTWTKHEHWEPPNWEGNASIGVVNLARLINEPSILPSALLACVYMDEIVLVDFEREDGSSEKLAREDLSPCLKASWVIRHANITGAMRTFQDTVSPACKMEMACLMALRRALQKLEGVMDGLITGFPFKLGLLELLRQKGRVMTFLIV